MLISFFFFLSSSFCLNLLDLPFGTVTQRIFHLPNGAPPQTTEIAEEGPAASSADVSSSSFRAPPKSSARRTHQIIFSGIEVDLSGLEQLIHPSQARCILGSLLYLRDRCSENLSVRDAVKMLDELFDAQGCAAVSTFDHPSGDLVRPRALEIAGALNRLRGVAVRHL